MSWYDQIVGSYGVKRVKVTDPCPFCKGTGAVEVKLRGLAGIHADGTSRTGFFQCLHPNCYRGQLLKKV